MKEISEIQRLVSTYYVQKGDKGFILSSIEFNAGLEMGIALSCYRKKYPDLVSEEEVLSVFKNSKDWKNVQEDFSLLEKIVEACPEFISALNLDKVPSLFLSYLNQQAEFKPVASEDLVILMEQLPPKYLSSFEKFVGGKLAVAILQFHEGFKEPLVKIVNEYSEDLEYLVMEVEDAVKKLQVPTVNVLALKNSQDKADQVIFNMLDNQPLIVENDKKLLAGRLPEVTEVFKKKLLRPSSQIVNYFEYFCLNLGDVETKTLVSSARAIQIENSHYEEFEKIISLPVPLDVLGLLKVSWSVGAIELAEILVRSQRVSVELVYQSLFDFSRQFSDAQLFIQYCEKLQQANKVFKIHAEMNVLKKIALGLNVSKQNNLKSYSFDLIIYEFLVKELGLASFLKGTASFQTWYPEIYQDILEMESFKTFYDQEQFLAFFKKDLNTSQQEQVVLLKQVLDLSSKKTGEMLRILQNDLQREVHSESGTKFDIEDLQVLSVFAKKLSETHEYINKIQQKFTADKNIDDLFLTDKHAYSMSNLKGNHFGELKAAGLDNFQGNSQQLSEIFKAFDFLINPSIQKEVDHFFYVKNDKMIDLRLVETKNYVKVVTEKNKRMADIKFQKNKLDVSIDSALANNNSGMQVNTHAELVMLKGLTENAKNNLMKLEPNYTPYNLVQGLVYLNQNFIDNLTDISSRMSKNSKLVQIEPDLKNYFEMLKLMKQDGASNQEIVAQVKKLYDKFREVPPKELDGIKKHLQELSREL